MYVYKWIFIILYYLQQIFDELKEVIDSIKLISEEEVKSKNKDIEYLKNQVMKLNQQREESLENQRKDLTNTFEYIINQREETFRGFLLLYQ